MCQQTSLGARSRGVLHGESGPKSSTCRRPSLRSNETVARASELVRFGLNCVGRMTRMQIFMPRLSVGNCGRHSTCCTGCGRGGGVTGKGTDGRSVNTRVKQDLHAPCVSRRSRLLYHQWHHHHDGNRHLFLIIEKVNSSDVCDLSVGHARRDDDGRGKSAHAYHIRMSLLRIGQAVRLSAALLWRENGIPGCCARAPAWRSEQACILTDSASLQRSKLHGCFTN